MYRHRIYTQPAGSGETHQNVDEIGGEKNIDACNVCVCVSVDEHSQDVQRHQFDQHIHTHTHNIYVRVA